RALLVTADLSRRNVARASLQTSPLRNAGRTDPERTRNRAGRLALLNPSQRTFSKIDRIGSRHPYRPRSPARSLNQNSADSGIADSVKTRRALACSGAGADDGDAAVGVGRETP